ncbi:hypothetical protein BN59_02324 [Legionella massiliensis]|uniref:Uncharacterized protein n=1 Tax=Legionella massiliensis TaxID=1034943 RepID=A0A078KY99_9GAMM|nr:hypothetical protein [Legionella massiliensis]CDZ78027.1 hypothetical protein BN59_02324 [Legionella massiliensis]CEE13765.1 hypothetical protein BN1094_02324 [Legionella massiliensis]
MKRFLAILLIGFISGPTIAEVSTTYKPNVNFYNLKPDIHTVFYGEQVVLPIYMDFTHLKTHQQWLFPANVQPQNASGFCPPFINSKIYIDIGFCFFNVVITGDRLTANRLNNVISGVGLYRYYGSENGVHWDESKDLRFSVEVIPHPLSMANLPLQNAIANLPVYVDLKRYVNYYDENIQAGSPAAAEVSPQQLDGLYYDPARFAIVGTPSRTGSYQFSIAVQNAFSKSAATKLYFDVGVNQRDKPAFRKNYQVASATPGLNYQLNLMEFIEPKASFLLSNPVHFRIDTNESHPDWLSIGGPGETVLQGTIPVYEAGTTRQVTIIASSNTGGDSEPLRLQIPIVIDPASKSHISPFVLKKSAGTEFEYDVRQHIFDPANDASLQLIIDKVEPAASWLRISPSSPTALIGTIPDNAVGQLYQVSLHTNTRIGGNSEVIKIQLAIDFDQEKRPRFKAENPQFPIASLGVPYEHDFVFNRDIYPDYEDEAYVVEFAESCSNPSWLRIEDNKLLSDQVPEDLDEQFYEICLTIKNKAGGKSEAIPLTLVAMN